MTSVLETSNAGFLTDYQQGMAILKHKMTQESLSIINDGISRIVVVVGAKDLVKNT